MTRQSPQEPRTKFGFAPLKHMMGAGRVTIRGAEMAVLTEMMLFGEVVVKHRDAGQARRSAIQRLMRTRLVVELLDKDRYVLVLRLSLEGEEFMRQQTGASL